MKGGPPNGGQPFLPQMNRRVSWLLKFMKRKPDKQRIVSIALAAVVSLSNVYYTPISTIAEETIMEETVFSEENETPATTVSEAESQLAQSVESQAEIQTEELVVVEPVTEPVTETPVVEPAVTEAPVEVQTPEAQTESAAPETQVAAEPQATEVMPEPVYSVSADADRLYIEARRCDGQAMDQNADILLQEILPGDDGYESLMAYADLVPELDFTYLHFYSYAFTAMDTVSGEYEYSFFFPGITNAEKTKMNESMLMLFTQDMTTGEWSWNTLEDALDTAAENRTIWYNDNNLETCEHAVFMRMPMEQSGFIAWSDEFYGALEYANTDTEAVRNGTRPEIWLKAVDSKGRFAQKDSVSFTFLDDNSEAIKSLQALYAGYDIATVYPMDISLYDKDGNKKQPVNDVTVELTVGTPESFDGLYLFHQMPDGNWEEIPYAIYAATDETPAYVQFVTKSFSPFIFAEKTVKEAEQSTGNGEMEEVQTQAGEEPETPAEESTEAQSEAIVASTDEITIIDLSVAESETDEEEFSSEEVFIIDIPGGIESATCETETECSAEDYEFQTEEETETFVPTIPTLSFLFQKEEKGGTFSPYAYDQEIVVEEGEKELTDLFPNTLSTTEQVEGTQRMYTEEQQFDHAELNGTTVLFIKKENGKYFVKGEGEDWKEIGEDCEIRVFYRFSSQKAIYYYEDEEVRVNAETTSPSSIPDSAIFKVTPLTREEHPAAYEAYRNAAGKEMEDDILLYDIAFFMPKADAEGNAIPNEYVELKLDDEVKITFEWKEEKEEEYEITHLPLSEEVVKTADSTQEVIERIEEGEIGEECIGREEIEAEKKGEGEITFTTNGFSIFAASPLRATGETFDYSFTKIWDDSGYELYRPESVTVKLYKKDDMNTVIDTVVLTSADATDANTWVGTFHGLTGENKEDYVIVEDFVPGYSTLYDMQNPQAFVVTYDREIDAATENNVFFSFNNGSSIYGAWHIVGAQVINGNQIVCPFSPDMKNCGYAWFIPDRHVSPELSITNISISGIYNGSQGHWINDSGYTLIGSTPVHVWSADVQAGHPELSVIKVDSEAYWRKFGWNGSQTTFPGADLISNTFNIHNLPVKKVWEDTGYEQHRPDSITVMACHQSTPDVAEATITLTAQNTIDEYTWQGQFKNLVHPYDEYIIKEAAVDGYQASYRQEDTRGYYTIVNTYCEYMIEKVWDDEGFESIRPASITINLYDADDEDTILQSKTLTSGDALDDHTWHSSFEGIDAKNGPFVVNETNIPTHYITTTEALANAVEITFGNVSNNNTDAIYADSNSPTGYSSIRIQKNSTIVIPAADGNIWFRNVPMCIVSIRPVYSSSLPVGTTITAPEQALNGTPNEIVLNGGAPEFNYAERGYNSSIKGWHLALDMYAIGHRITNTINLIHVPVRKVWDDAGYENIRPASVTFSVYDTNAPTTAIDTLTLTATNAVAGSTTTWEGVFRALPRYRSDGTLATYVVKENVPSGYLKTESFNANAVEITFGSNAYGIIYYRDKTSSTGYSIVDLGNNTYANSTINVHAEDGEIWFANAPITINNVRPVYTTTFAPSNTTSQITMSSVTEITLLNSIPAYAYEYDRTNPPYMHLAVDMGSLGYNFTNTPDITRLPIVKVWDDAGHENLRPASVTFTAYDTIAPTVAVANLTMTADNAEAGNANVWEGVFDNLPKHRQDGSIATYLVTERGVGSYSSTSVPLANAVEITFGAPAYGSVFYKDTEHSPESGYSYVNIQPNTSVIVPTEDGNIWFANAPMVIQSIRPIVAAQEDFPTGIPMANNGYITSARFDELNAMTDGIVLEYGISDYNGSARDGFHAKADITALGHKFTNTVELVDIPVQKTWDDAGHESARPSSVTVELYDTSYFPTDPLYNAAIATVTLDAVHGWSGEFSDVPSKNNRGESARYAVRENAVTGYTSVTTSDKAEGFLITFSEQSTLTGSETLRFYADPYWITIDANAFNTYCSGKTIFIPCIGFNNPDRSQFYPQVSVYAPSGISGDFEITSITLTDTLDMASCAVFDISPSSSRNPDSVVTSNPQEASETIKGKKITNIMWDASNGFTVTNRYASKDVQITKIWDDADHEFKRPTSITFEIYDVKAPSTVVATSVLNTSNTTDQYTWAKSVSLPRFRADGSEAEYAAREQSVPSGYESQKQSDELKGFIVRFDKRVLAGGGGVSVYTINETDNTWGLLNLGAQGPDMYTTEMSGKEIFVPVGSDGTAKFAIFIRSNSNMYGVTVASVTPTSEEGEYEYASPAVSVMNPTTTINISATPYRLQTGVTVFTYDKTNWSAGTTVENTYIPTEYPIRILKKDADNAMLAGATLQITGRISGASVDITPITITTLSDGNTVNLEAGTYTLTETKAPDGYVKAQPINFTVMADGTIQSDGNIVTELTMTDEPTNIQIRKLVAGTNTPVIGAKLTLTTLQDIKYNGNTYTTGSVIENWTTTSTHMTLQALPAGQYTLTETEVPSAYKLAEPITFRVSETSSLQVFTMYDEIASANLNIKKIDKYSKATLAGAKFGIYTDAACTDTNKKYEITTGVNGIGTQLIEPGTYYVKELKAPTGYRLDMTIYGPYTINGTDLDLVFANRPNNYIATGVLISIGGAVALVAIATALLILMRMKRKKKNESAV